MTPLRKFLVSFTALGCAGLLGCSSGGEPQVAPALPPAAASASASADRSAPPAPPSSGTVAPVPAPDGGTGATAVPPAPGLPGAPGGPTTAAPKPPPAQPNPQPNPANPGTPGTPPLPQLGDPAQAVAAAGPQGQTYLKMLQARGIPSNPALDGIYVLFGKAVCDAKSRGTARTEILNQFGQIGPMLAPGTSLPPPQVAEVFVSAAEQTLC